MGVKDKLRELMSINQLNASQLAEKAQLPKSTVYSLLKRDSFTLSYATAEKLAYALRCPVGELLGLGNENSNYMQGLIEEYSKLSIQFNNAVTDNDADTMKKLAIKLDDVREKIADAIDENNKKQVATVTSELLKNYSELNYKGKTEAVKRVRELTQIDEYSKEEEE